MSDEEVLPEVEFEGVINEAVINQVAAFATRGMAKSEMKRRLKMSEYFLNKIYKDERFRQLVVEIGDEAVAESKSYIRNEFAKLSPDVVKVVKNKLKADSLEAVKIFLRALGMETTGEEESKGSGNMTVVLAVDQSKKEEVIKVDK